MYVFICGHNQRGLAVVDIIQFILTLAKIQNLVPLPLAWGWGKGLTAPPRKKAASYEMLFIASERPTLMNL